MSHISWEVIRCVSPAFLSYPNTPLAQEDDLSTLRTVPRATGAQAAVCTQNLHSPVFVFSRKGSFQTFGKDVCITGQSVRKCPQPLVPPMGERRERRVSGWALPRTRGCMVHLSVPTSLYSLTSSPLPPETRSPWESLQ